MTLQEYKALRLAEIPKGQQAQWLETHLIVPDTKKAGEWMVLEVLENNSLDKYSKWLG